MSIAPTTPEELAGALAEAQAARQQIALFGNQTKKNMGGPLTPAAISISVAGLNRVLQYEPRDLTISVGAGITFAELSRVLAQHQQMIPLDPPYAANATVGGIIAANTCGPRRRLYGTARDMVIGMTFATVEGKLVETGGMVVKNVAGLDMGKLMIGSFGTLAALAVVNFKLQPMPAGTRTFVQKFDDASSTVTARDQVLKSILQPTAIDILKTDGRYELYVQAAGSAGVLQRYSAELPGSEILEGEPEQAFWDRIREFTPNILSANPAMAVVRISCKLAEVGTVLESLPSPALARAGNGVCYGYFADAELAVGRGVIEFAPDSLRESGLLWPSPGSDFEMMKKIKAMFDPLHLLNAGRLYGRI